MSGGGNISGNSALQVIEAITQFVNGTQAVWNSVTIPIPLGLIVYATDTTVVKMGDGVTLYANLPVVFTISDIITLSAEYSTLSTTLAGLDISTLSSEVTTLMSEYTAQEAAITALQTTVATLATEASLTTLQTEVTANATNITTLTANVENSRPAVGLQYIGSPQASTTYTLTLSMLAPSDGYAVAQQAFVIGSGLGDGCIITCECLLVGVGLTSTSGESVFPQLNFAQSRYSAGDTITATLTMTVNNVTPVGSFEQNGLLFFLPSQN